MSEEKQYQFKNYVIGYDKDIRDKSSFTICEKKEDYLLVIGTLQDKSADILDEWLEHLHLENERLNNIINRTTKYVQSLSSKGRGCDIYEDIKQEILKELKGEDKE